MKFNKTVYQSFSLIGQFGINMLVPVFLCSFLGIYIDKWLETDFAVIILFFIGAITGGYNVYRMSKRHLKKTDENSAYMHGTGHNNRIASTLENEDNKDKQNSF